MRSQTISQVKRNELLIAVLAFLVAISQFSVLAQDATPPVETPELERANFTILFLDRASGAPITSGVSTQLMHSDGTDLVESDTNFDGSVEFYNIKVGNASIALPAAVPGYAFDSDWASWYADVQIWNNATDPFIIYLDKDTDSDGIADANGDNCVDTSNADQLDSDGDGVGDVCDETPSPSTPTEPPVETPTSFATEQPTDTGQSTPSSTAVATDTPATPFAPNSTPPADVLPNAALSYVVTDEFGNVFTFQVTLVKDGTGHGTTDQCFINSTTGYAVGDNAADDGVVCSGDEVEWRIDWNVVTGINPQPLNLNISQTSTAARNPGLRLNGTTGGTDLPFTGTSVGNPGNAPSATINFDANSTASGFFTVTSEWPVSLLPSSGWDGEQVLSVFAKWQSQTVAQGASAASSPLTIRQEARVDVVIDKPVVEGFQTTINGTPYLSIMSKALLPGFPQDSGRTAFYPGYSNVKGYTNDINRASSGLRYTFEGSNAFTTAFCSVNGGAQTPAAQDVNGDWFCLTTRLDDIARIYFPASEVPSGQQIFTLRLDPIESVDSLQGHPAFNGLPDPGVGVSCQTTTLNILPGTKAGTTAPNNNCAMLTYVPPALGDNFKRNTGGYTNIEVEGTTYSLVAPAVGADNAMNGYPINSVISVEPRTFPSTEDMAVCDVWIPGTERFAPASNASTPYIHAASTDPVPVGQNINSVQRVESFYPGAVVYYTTQDLTAGGTANCGSPSDGVSGWTTARPAELDISGWMVVFPGTNTLVAPIYLYTTKVGNDPANYDSLITVGVENFMGVVPISANGETEITTSSTMNVISDIAGIYRAANAQTGGEARVGSSTITAQAGGNLILSSDQPLDDPNGIVTMRVYVDNCLNNPVATSPDTIVVIGPDANSTACGITAGSSYIERTLTFREWLDWQWAGNQTANVNRVIYPITYTFDTPAWSAPGDSFITREVLTIPAEGGDTFWTRTGAHISQSDLRITIPSSAVVSSTKSTDSAIIPQNGSFTNTVGWYNYTSAELGETQFIDVLPFNGDGRGTSFSGTLTLTSVTYSGRAAVANNTNVEYTSADPSTVSSNPADPTNTTGITVWCTESEFGSAGCPASIAETTALRFTTADLSPNHSQFFTLGFTTEGNEGFDVYFNSLSAGVSAGLGEVIPAPVPVKTEVEEPLPTPTLPPATPSPTSTVPPVTPNATPPSTPTVTPLATSTVAPSPTPSASATPAVTSTVAPSPTSQASVTPVVTSTVAPSPATTETPTSTIGVTPAVPMPTSTPTQVSSPVATSTEASTHSTPTEPRSSTPSAGSVTSLPDTGSAGRSSGTGLVLVALAASLVLLIGLGHIARRRSIE